MNILEAIVVESTLRPNAKEYSKLLSESKINFAAVV